MSINQNILQKLLFDINKNLKSENYTDARIISNEAINIARKKKYDEPRSVADLVNIFEQHANIENYFQNFEKAEQSYLEALSYFENENINPLQIARIEGSLAYLYEEKNEYELAIPYYENAIKIYQLSEPPSLLDITNYSNNLGLLYKYIQNYDKAEKNFLTALDVYEDRYGLLSEECATVYNNLGSMYFSAGFIEQSREMHQESLDIRLSILGIESPETAQSYSNLATALEKMNENKLAESNYIKSLSILEKSNENHFNDLLIVSENYYEFLKKNNDKKDKKFYKNKLKKIL